MLRLFNTLTRQLSEVEPSEHRVVKMYTCGPTVYRDAHLGNLRSYLMADWIRRALEAQGLTVEHVKNITDVGHMRQERLEQGEDKVIAAAVSEGKTPAQIAQFYTDRFLRDERALNVKPARRLPKATDHVAEMVEIVQRLVEKGHAYEAEGNVYFDIASFAGYGSLSGNVGEADLLEAVRVEADPLKRDPRDFTLWKAAEPGRELKWPSRWGDGFPGWHIECSAMSIKYLGERFQIHTGGVDNIFPHHEGELAQSEGYTGGRVVDTWVHGQHLLADGVKMAKSTGNSFILADIESRGFDPMAFRYLCLTAGYKTRLNFTFGSLKAAERGLSRLQRRAWEWSISSPDAEADSALVGEWNRRFLERVNDDLDMPGALALTWEMTRSDIAPAAKLSILSEFDRVLGLGLDGLAEVYGVPHDAGKLVEERARQRRRGEFAEADGLREQIGRAGYVVEDAATGSRVRPKTPWERRQERWRSISSSTDVKSLIDEPDDADATFGIVASGYLDDVRRCLKGALSFLDDRSVEAVVVDNGSDDETGAWLEQVARGDPRIRVIHADHVLGEGAARNVVLKQSRGEVVVLLDTSVEVVGDILTPIENILQDDTVGVAGGYGLRTGDLHHFHDGEGEAGEMDAMQGYCFAFRRERLRDVGMMREGFRFYRNLDLDYSFHFREKGYRIVADPTLPLELHEHRAWAELTEDARDELSRKNYRRFLDRWGHRTDLLVSNQGRA